MNRVKLVNSDALFRKSYFQIPKKSKGKTSNDQDFIQLYYHQPLHTEQLKLKIKN